MIEKKDILKMIKHVSKRSRGVPDKRMIHPKREWLIGIVIFILICIGGGIYNVITYKKFNNLQSEITDTKTQIVKLKTDNVSEALEKFRSRRERYQSLQQNIPVAPLLSTATSSEEVEEDSEPNQEEVVSDNQDQLQNEKSPEGESATSTEESGTEESDLPQAKFD